MSTDEIKEQLMMETKSVSAVNPKDLLSTGSTLLNLACSGRPNGGFIKGKYFFVVGDSSSGKTFLTLTCFAEAARNPNFDGYDFIHDNAEDGALMEYEHFFGKKTKERIRPPSDKGSSTTVEEFYQNLDAAFKTGKPFIYVLDSMDCLTSEEELGKFEEKVKLRKKKEKALAEGRQLKEEAAGTYGTGKAKANSTNLRLMVNRLSETGSILIIIAQTRDNIGTFTFEKKTRSGGHALKFYATLELWSSVKEQIKKTVKGKQRVIGITSQVQVKKNRLNGRNRRVALDIYFDSGFDDVGSCVDYLLEEGHWKDNNGINAKEMDFKGKREDLIKHIEANDLEKELRSVVTQVWREIEDQCRVERKRRYE